MVLTKDERYLWVGDRAANRIIVVDTATDSVANEINLAGNLSADPAPDSSHCRHRAIACTSHCVVPIRSRATIPMSITPKN